MSLAEEALAGAVKRRIARSALVKSSDAYEALYKRLQQTMTNAWNDKMRQGITSALDRLRDLGPGAFTDEDGAMILRVLEGSVGAEAIRAAMHDPVINLSDGLFRVGVEEVAKGAGVSIAFQRPDLDALDVLKTGNLYWVGNSWNSHTQDLLAAALDDYFRDGMTRDGLAARFAEDFASLTERGQRYWTLLADHTATKTREMGRVTGYERVGAREVQVRAHLDKRTTEICRQMHGRIIPVSRLREQRDTYLDAMSRRDEAAAKAAWTMHGQNTDFSNTATGKLGKGTGGPPYHFLCRTITVMYFRDQEDDLGRWTRKVQDREPLGRKDIEAIVQQAKSATWPHTKVVRGHFRKHQKKLGVENQADYSQSAIDLIRRGDRDVYLSMRKGVLNATFVRKAARADKRNKDGFVITSVDMSENKITSHHWRENLKTTGDEVPNRKQMGRGISKWLFGK